MNNEVRIREATAEEVSGWDDLIARFGNRHVSHSMAWLRSLENSVKGKILFLVYEKNGRVVGCLPGMIVMKGPFRLFGSSLPGWQTDCMGPVFDETEISTREMIAPLIPYLEKNYGIHHVEIMCSTLDHQAMEKIGFHGRPEYTFQARLFPEDEEKAFKNMKQTARRNIRRAWDHGLIAKEIEDESFVDEVYDQVTEVFLRGGNTVPYKKNRVLEFFRNMKQSGKLLALGVYLPDQKTCIATGLFVIENSELLLWSWTHRREYGSYNPTEFMTWTAMQIAMQRGCDIFEMAGRGNFKAKFGAKLSDSKYRWVRSRYRWLGVARDIAEKAYRYQQAARGKAIRSLTALISNEKKAPPVSSKTASV